MKIPLLTFMAMSKKAKCLALSPQGDEISEVADLRRDLTERAGNKAGRALRVASGHLFLDEPGCVCWRVEFHVGLLAAVLVHLARALLDGRSECRVWRLRAGLLWCPRLDISKDAVRLEACVRFVFERLKKRESVLNPGVISCRHRSLLLLLPLSRFICSG